MSIPVTLELGNIAEPESELEILTFSRLSGLRKVAVLFRSLALQDEAAARILLESLNSMAQAMIKEELDSMGVLGADMVTDVLREFDVLCAIHKAYREGGVDGAISVGEKFLHRAQARRLAQALGSQNGEVSEVLEETTTVEEVETPAEMNGQVASGDLEATDDGSLDDSSLDDGSLDDGAEEEIVALADLEEKDLEDVVN